MRKASFTFFIPLLTLLLTTARSDVASDRAECADQLVSLATCLPYVQGTSKVPTPDCCAGLEQVLAKSKKCLCVLIRDRDDPQLGIKINATLALALPTVCKAHANISHCPALLNLTPGSKEAAIFEQGGSGSSTTPTPPKGNSTSSSETAGSKSSPTQASNSAATSFNLVLEKCFLVQLIVAFYLSVLTPFLLSS
ncbi:hypothetical protein LUZ60_005909 [Juncus effusus]|nr:hypothetical protein LUZ60_005909 [Juncus effusus]